MKRLYALLLGIALLTLLLPTTALAANETVLIGGLSLTEERPYYFNGVSGAIGTRSASETQGGASWNACLKKGSDGAYTLHLRDLDLSTSMAQTIETQNIDYLLLEGRSSVSTTNGDSGAAAIACDDLTVCGGGALTAAATAGYGIRSGSAIELQYNASLTVSGANAATNVQVTCREGANAYKADDRSDTEINAYFADTELAVSQKYVRFTSKAAAFFPIVVNNIQVTAANKGNVLNDANKTVQYTPAAGSTPAKLTLTGANISTVSNLGAGSGIYATESLEIYLKGSNTIAFQPAVYLPNASGVFVDGHALTITAEPGASLVSRVTAPAGSGCNCYGLRASGAGRGTITINGGSITAEGLAGAGTGVGIYADTTLRVTADVVNAGCSGNNANSLAVRAEGLQLGTGMAILTPVGGKAPTGGRSYITDSDGNVARAVVIGRSSDPAIPETDDHSQPALWLGILLLSGAGLAASLVPKRRRAS